MEVVDTSVNISEEAFADVASPIGRSEENLNVPSSPHEEKRMKTNQCKTEVVVSDTRKYINTDIEETLFEQGRVFQ